MDLWHKIFPGYVCPGCGAKLEKINDQFVASTQLVELSADILWGLVGAVVAATTFKLLGEIAGLAVAVLVVCWMGLRLRRYWCNSCKRVVSRAQAIKAPQARSGEGGLDR